MYLSCTSLSQNLVVAVSAEGWLHLFDLTSTKALDASGHHETLGEEQRPVFKQHIPANTKVMLISDIGEHEQLKSRGLGLVLRNWAEGESWVRFVCSFCVYFFSFYFVLLYFHWLYV